MHVLITAFLIISPLAHSADQFLQQCQEFRTKIELELVKGSEPSKYPNQCLMKLAGSVSYCMSEQNFKNYIKDVALKVFNSNEEELLYNDELLRCSFFGFHRVRLVTNWRNSSIDFLLWEFEDIQELLEQEHITDDKFLRRVLYNINLNMEEIQYADSFNLEQWPTRIELNDILNDYMVEKYNLSTRIDFIGLMLKQEERKRHILAD